MRCVIPSQYRDRIPFLLSEVGYVLHCQAANQACYHRQLHTGRFPRFHLFVTPGEEVYAIDLHLDQYNLHHHGNHGEPWAYTGARIHEEITHILEHLKNDHVCVGAINQPNLGFVSASTRDRPLSYRASHHSHTPWRWQATPRI